jgi:dihydropteroate synthase
MIQDCSELKNKIISVDTTKAWVAERALKLGANMINDYSGGRPDEGMFDLVRENFFPYICLQIKDLLVEDHPKEFYLSKYKNGVIDDVIFGIQKLITKLNQNYLEGTTNNFTGKKNEIYIPDWNQIIESDVFHYANNLVLEILRNSEKVKYKFPNVVFSGHTKKRFIRDICNVDEYTTAPGDIALCPYMINKGANILRAHQFELIGKSIKLSRALLFDDDQVDVLGSCDGVCK